MAQFKIPKLSRNKYNYVKGEDGNKYVTLSDLMMSSGRGGSLGLNNVSSTQVQSIVNNTLDEREVVTSYDLKTVNGYSLVGSGDIEITSSGSVDLSAYVTKEYMSYQSYVTSPSLQNVLDESAYINAYVCTQQEYNDMSSDEKNRDTIYIVSDQQPYEENDIVTKSELSSFGYLTSDNFVYDSYTGTLTINI